ncbi:hypothetical protein ACIBM1_23640 [Streptomyces sp. NPDC050481]|uniref:hypothetical protein n=1 Tax=Streptomyces sp. NPDC050481 TaxID=3365616 RepID=UPI0037B1CDC9
MAGEQAGLAVVVGTAATANGVNGSWRSFLRRFDLEHTFRLFRDEVGSCQATWMKTMSGRVMLG